MKLIGDILLFPLRVLGGLMFLAMLEGAFGAPTGAQRLLRWTLRVLGLALLAGIVGLGVWATVSGFGVQLWLGLGAFVLASWLLSHLRWSDG